MSTEKNKPKSFPEQSVRWRLLVVPEPQLVGKSKMPVCDEYSTALTAISQRAGFAMTIENSGEATVFRNSHAPTNLADGCYGANIARLLEHLARLQQQYRQSEQVPNTISLADRLQLLIEEINIGRMANPKARWDLVDQALVRLKTSLPLDHEYGSVPEVAKLQVIAVVYNGDPRWCILTALSRDDVFATLSVIEKGLIDTKPDWNYDDVKAELLRRGYVVIPYEEYEGAE
jgi:hypothetical protein